MYLIVGLGNPGKEYEKTRHNVGYMVADRLAIDHGIAIKKSLCSAITGQGLIKNNKVLLAKPLTFMNLSGDSVSELVDWYKIEPDHVIVVHDDLDLEPGILRIRQKGSSGGHNGVQSVIDRLKTVEFIRVKIGIGRKVLGGDNSGYVLDNISKEQLPLIMEAVNTACEAILMLVEKGLDDAMNKYNSL